MTTTHDDNATTWRDLADVEAIWDKRLHCEITTNRGTRCRRPASWRINVHGCEQRLMCTGHLHRWQQRTLAVLRVDGRTRCGMCGLWFTSMETVCGIVAL